MNKTFLITGSSRGVGLELCRQLLEAGHRVIATARHPELSARLKSLADHHHATCRVKTLDVQARPSVIQLAAQLKDEPRIDVLINNAGILKEYHTPLRDLTMDVVREMFEVNTFGPVRVTRALLPLLKKSAKPIVMNITSGVGSLARHEQGPAYGYRMSKAALNMFNRCLSTEFPELICVTVSPGWVKTDMGGANAQLTPEESARHLRALIDRLTPADTGKFLHHTGGEIPW